jgi:DNA-binding response OmpR family regulator
MHASNFLKRALTKLYVLAGWPQQRQREPALTTLADVAQVLVIEDDPTIRSALVRALGERGHAVSSAPDALTGLREAVSETPPDLVVLDLGLPDLDGAELLRMLRAVSSVPVIVATARDDEVSVVRALDAGADDYLTKPFSADQLDARIRAVLRRSAGTEAPTELCVAGLIINTASREAELDTKPLELTPREFDLLSYLMARPGVVVSKRELLTEVWRLPYGGADKTVDVHLSWLRRKLGETAQNPRFLVSVRGVGVKVVDPNSD